MIDKKTVEEMTVDRMVVDEMTKRNDCRRNDCRQNDCRRNDCRHNDMVRLFCSILKWKKYDGIALFLGEAKTCLAVLRHRVNTPFLQFFVSPTFCFVKLCTYPLVNLRFHQLTHFLQFSVCRFTI